MLGKADIQPLEPKFYFGDKNLPRDKFLRQKTEEDDGWVTFECLATFNRLKSMSDDVNFLAKTMKKSSSDLIEVSEDLTKVRRTKSKPVEELTTEARQKAKAKTVYVKGFPKEATLDELQEYFEGKGKIVFIMMRKTLESKEFKGSVFIEFATLPEAKAFVEEKDTKYQDNVLIKKFKDDYYSVKNADKKKRLEEEQKARKEEIAAQVKSEEKLAEEEEEFKYEKGAVLHFTDVGEQTSREDLKELFGEHEDIAWVNFSRGDTEGHIRFLKEGGAQRAMDALKKDDKILIRNKQAIVRVLEGDEEKEFYRKDREEKQKRRHKKGRDFGRGRGRGGKRRNFERSDQSAPKGTHTHFDKAVEPPAKQIKKEEQT
ncbi:lupus La protein homolog isoform X1 [Nematostella vectensis]|uniref:lupus La protein homolog isoform X1 n=1 Tax=Nematostella vectensis TaxID=45351 RepID=UPI0020777E69|nr:lupus La protein homolog isoform X1 [Nematostella vectensis]